MTYDTAREWEREAERIGEMMVRKSGGAWKLEKCGCKNVKPLYNPRWMFEPRDEGVKRVFVGIRPAGDPCEPLEDNPSGDMLEYLDDCPSDRPHNQWIDGHWGGRGPTHQSLVQRVFESLYGKGGWKRELRATPSFNVCPLRVKDYPPLCSKVYDKSEALFLDMVEGLRPQTIICNGTGEWTPWRALNPKNVRSWRIGEDLPRRPFLRHGEYKIGEGSVARVIGFPALTGQVRYYDRPSLMRLLETHRDKLIGHESP